MQATQHQSRRAAANVLLSMTHPNKELFYRQRALLRRAVPAGFPSPADDYVEQRISLDEHLITRRDSTFFMRVAGESMRGLGIFDGDLLVVDRSLTPSHRTIVIAVVDGEFTVKRLYRREGRIRLLAENPDFAPMEFNEGQELQIWGVVTSVIHRMPP